VGDVTTVGNLLVSEALPEDMRRGRYDLTKKGVHKLFDELARKHPEKYKQVLNDLSDVGKTAVWTEGLSVSLAGLARSKAKEAVLGPVRERIRQIVDDDNLDNEQRKKAIIDTLIPVTSQLQDALLEEARAENSPFATQIDSGARGKKSDLSSLRGADLLATDQADKFIPIPLLRGYAQGLTPAEYFAASYGQRKGALDVKMCIAEGTRVRMGDGSSKPIEDVKGGEWVMAANLFGDMTKAQVRRVYKNGMRECRTIRVATAAGAEPKELTCTADHKVLMRGSPAVGFHMGKVPVEKAQNLMIAGHAVPQRVAETTVRAMYSPETYDNTHPPLVAWRLGPDVPAGELMTYDLEIGHEDHMYVLENGIIVENSTADAGFLTKQIVNAAHRQIVDKEQPEPTRLPVGLPVETKDKDNIGGVLAKDAGKFKAGTILTESILEDLQDEDVEEILLHSPMTELSQDGGLSQLAVGRRSKAGFHDIGDNVGVPAAQAIGERISQGSLDSKHSAGVNTRLSKSGFEYINRLIQAPENFPEAGPLVHDEGTVTDINEAPQGGHYIKVGDKAYYAGPDLQVQVKVGDQMEQGDTLTDGIPHPGELVKLRGMGEARRTYMHIMREALENSNVPVQRRNLESVVSGLLNWAKVTDPEGVGDHVYDDVVPFNSLMASYKPRANAGEHNPSKSVGKYLEEPALHYTPGTRITKKVAKDLEKWGIDKVYSHDEEPDFQPHMVRGLYSVYHDPDWKTRQMGFYTSSAFQRSLHRGAESDTKGTSFAPRLADPDTLTPTAPTFEKFGAALRAALAGSGTRE